MPRLAALAALAGLMSCAAAPSPETMATSYFVNLDLVKKIICHGEKGEWSGTGSYVDRDLILTADHVVAHGACAIDGVPVQTIYEDGKLDVAVVKTPTLSASRMPISCATPKQGEEYFAIGYPLGENFVIQRYTGTNGFERGGQFKGMAQFRGMSIPGQSGGPVVDRDGQLVGILNAGNSLNSMLSRLARDLWLCKGDAA